jgi:AbrB family looped-hinge helix DNA binding protein
MNHVTISPKFQVVIPAAIREDMGLEPGMKCEVISYNGRIEFVPIKSMRAMQGFLRGMDTTIERDNDRL